jgi:hypothetical protein
MVVWLRVRMRGEKDAGKRGKEARVGSKQEEETKGKM